MIEALFTPSTGYLAVSGRIAGDRKILEFLGRLLCGAVTVLSLHRLNIYNIFLLLLCPM